MNKLTLKINPVNGFNLLSGVQTFDVKLLVAPNGCKIATSSNKSIKHLVSVEQNDVIPAGYHLAMNNPINNVPVYSDTEPEKVIGYYSRFHKDGNAECSSDDYDAFFSPSNDSESI